MYQLNEYQEKWLQALEQHPERQMRYSLGEIKEDGTLKCCCLGQGAIVCDTASFIDNILTTKKGCCTIALDINTCEILKLRGQEGEFKEQDKYIGSTYKSLSDMNDRCLEWPEIAAYIRANPENVFKD